MENERDNISSVNLVLDEEHPWPALGAFPEEAERFFNGRSSESEQLLNHVIQAPLTILFGRSGLGKTSLLKAGLYPRLRKKYILPIHIELDPVDRSAPLIDQALQRLQKELQVRDIAAPELKPDETLWEYLHRQNLELWSPDNWQVTPLFVFDQFERIFTLGDPNVEGIRQLRVDLADLVENRIPMQVHQNLESGLGVAGIDLERQRARFLFSFREDFLPDFELWRGEIPSLMQSRFRLMPMTEEQAFEAVYHTGKKVVDKDVAGEIVQFVARAKLHTKEEGGANSGAEAAQSGAFIAPALLSVLCTGLNRRRKKTKKISLSLLQASADEIIEEFYTEGVKGIPEILVDFLESELITEGGYRKPCALEDAQDKGRLDQQTLEQLVKRRILRLETRDKVKWLDLTHDLLTPVVREHRDQRRQAVKQNLKKRRRLQQVLALFVGGILVAVFIVFWWNSFGKPKYELHVNTKGFIEELRGMPADERTWFDAARFDNAALYVLKKKGIQHYEFLKNILQENQDLVPFEYGIELADEENISLVDLDVKLPLSLRYSSKRGLNKKYFSLYWRDMAKSFAGEWGIPATVRLNLVEEANLPKLSMEFMNVDGNGCDKNNIDVAKISKLDGGRFDAQPSSDCENFDLDFDIPSYEDTVIISSKNLRPQAQKFFDHFPSEWQPVKAPKDAEKILGPWSWWIVPRWSLPVWKVSGQLATEGSSFSAFLLAFELLKEPQVLLTPQAVDFLLERIEKAYPHRVAEARAARGERLPQDLIEIVKNKRAIIDLPILLEVFANYPDLSSQDIATKIKYFSPANGEADLPWTLHGPWPSKETKLSPSDDTKEASPVTNSAYQEVEPWLPAVEKYEIRVYLGKELETAWARDGRLSPELLDRFELLQDDFFRRFGIELPGVGFRTGRWETKGTDKQFQIELFNETATDSADPIQTMVDTALDQLMDKLALRGMWARAQLLTSDSVYWKIKYLSEGLKAWLEQNYSLTDIKLLLRALVEPSGQELIESDDYGGMTGVEIPPAHTIRHLEWLLQSLLFWSQTDDAHDLESMKYRLRHTQQARIAQDTFAGDSEVGSLVQQGIKALAADRMKEADDFFSNAIKTDREAAIKAFLANFAAYLPKAVQDKLTASCKSSLRLTREERLDLEDLWQRSDPSTNARRYWGFCLLNAYPESLASKRNKLTDELLTEFGSPKDWPADEAAAMALELFQRYDPLTDPSALEQQAAEFLESALARQDLKKAGDSYYKFLEICMKPGPRNWCWQRAYTLTEARLADGDGTMSLDLAIQLSDRERLEDLERALRLVKNAEKNIEKQTGLSAEDRNWQLDVLRFTRARAFSRMVDLGDETQTDEAENLLRQSLQAPGWIGEYAHVYLARLFVDGGRYDEAFELLQEGLSKWPKDVSLYQYKFWQQLLTSDEKGAAKTTNEIIPHIGKNPNTLFAVTLGKFLTNQRDWEVNAREFITTDDPYVNYIAMLLYAYMAGESQDEGKQLLLKHWQDVDPSTWKARLKGGDADVWREMLIAYYLGKGDVDEHEIFDPLKDEISFNESNLSRIHLPRRGMLCEAYFYDALLAKAQGDKARMKSSMQKVLETGHKVYIEYKIAKYMLADEKWFR